MDNLKIKKEKLYHSFNETVGKDGKPFSSVLVDESIDQW